MKKPLASITVFAALLLSGCDGPAVVDIDSKVFPPELAPTTCFISDERKRPPTREDSIFRSALEEVLIAKGWRLVSGESEARVLIGYTEETTLRHYSAGSGYSDSLVPDPMNCANVEISTAGGTAGASLSYTAIKTRIHAQDTSVSPKRELWDIAATLPESYGTPEEVVPRFLKLTSAHIGKNTAGVIRIGLNDETVGRE